MIYHEYFGIEQANSTFYWTASSEAAAKADDSLVFTQANAKDIITCVPVGTMMRVITQATSTIHAFIIAGKNSEKVTVYECNMQTSPYCLVTLRALTYAEFVSNYKKLLYFSTGTLYDASLYGTQYHPNSQSTTFYSIGSLIKLTATYNVSNETIYYSAQSLDGTISYFPLTLKGEYKINGSSNTCTTVDYSSRSPSLVTSFSQSRNLPNASTQFWQYFRVTLNYILLIIHCFG